MIAAASMSAGIDRNAVRISRTFSGAIAVGRATPTGESAKPRPRTMTNREMIVTSAGTTSVATNSPNTALTPRNRSSARAYPARVAPTHVAAHHHRGHDQRVGGVRPDRHRVRHLAVVGERELAGKKLGLRV